MALHLVVDDIASVPERHRDQYLQREGKFHLDVEGLDELKSQITELRAELDQANDAILRRTISDALTRAGVEEGGDLLQDRLRSRVKFESLDGSKVVRITQADNESLMVGQAGEYATLDDLVKETASRFPSLFRSNGNSDRGHNSKSDNPLGPKVMSRKEFDALNSSERAARMKAGFKLIDAGSNTIAGKPVPAGATRRSEFEKLPASERMARMKAGGKLVD